jgi:hypothetical protein
LGTDKLFHLNINMKYACRGDFEVGDFVHRVGKMIQQAGDVCSSSENKNFCSFFTKAKKIKEVT